MRSYIFGCPSILFCQDESEATGSLGPSDAIGNLFSLTDVDMMEQYMIQQLLENGGSAAQQITVNLLREALF